MRVAVLIMFLAATMAAVAGYPEQVTAYVILKGATPGSAALSFVKDTEGYRILDWGYAFAQPKAPDLPSDADTESILRNYRQLAKSADLKKAENSFLLLCEFIGGEKVKLSFEELDTKLAALESNDSTAAVKLSLKLLAIDSKLKKLGGDKWWDTCAWHPEVVE